MKVQVIPLREAGKPLPMRLALERPAASGEFELHETQEPSLHRVVRRARVVEKKSGVPTDVVPEIWDAQVIDARHDELRVTGFERVDGVDYAQTWLLRLV